MYVFRADMNDSNSLTDNIIDNICGDKNGHIYIHTHNGLNEFDLRSSTMHAISHNKIDCISYGIQNLWIAKNNKLYKYKDGKEELYCEVNQSNSPIFSLLETVDQRIIVGTVSSGVFVIDQNKKIRSVITDCSRVVKLFEDSKRNIWVCTGEKGLYKISISHCPEFLYSILPLHRPIIHTVLCNSDKDASRASGRLPGSGRRLSGTARRPY